MRATSNWHKAMRQRCETINRLADRPLEPWTGGTANIGHVSYKYDGDQSSTYSLTCTVTSGGGVTVIHRERTIKALYCWTDGFLRGIQLMKHQSLPAHA